MTNLKMFAASVACAIGMVLTACGGGGGAVTLAAQVHRHLIQQQPPASPASQSLYPW